MGVSLELTARCDWPGCGNTLLIRHYYGGVWGVHRWKPSSHCARPDKVFCHDHADRRFDELRELERDVDSMGTL